MIVSTISGDEVKLLYHPADEAVEVGTQFIIREATNQDEGLLVQVISNDSLDYPGMQLEQMQRILESRLSTDFVVNRETGMGELKNIKVATAKIRKRIVGAEWRRWDGWIPTRNVNAELMTPASVREHILPPVEHPIAFGSYGDEDVNLEGSRLNMVNVLAGVKGSGKSHMAKHLAIGLSGAGVPVVIFDINREYIQLPDAVVFEWGETFRPNLLDMGFPVLETVVQGLYPFTTDPSRAAFAAHAENIIDVWRRRNAGIMTVANLISEIEATNENERVKEAIVRRLHVVNNSRLFANTLGDVGDYRAAYRGLADDGGIMVFDMHALRRNTQRALVQSIIRTTEQICNEEFDSGAGRYPFIFFEEAHLYVEDSDILNIITRGRHIGIGSVFVTNTPDRLPEVVFRQLDNLYLAALTHESDISSISKSSFADVRTVHNFATRMPQHHALVAGSITNNYPLVVRVNPLPAGVPPTGVTRSTWERMAADD